MLNLNALNLKAKVAAWKRPDVTRRSALFFLGCSLAFSTTLASCGGSSTNSGQQAASSGASPSASPVSSNSSGKKLFRVVRSKQLTALAVLEKQGILEKALEPLGYKVQWLEFAAGPQQLEAIKVGALDVASTAESPPVFAQASGTDLVYLATTPRNGKPVALLVPPNSPAKSIKDLKGKKIAFQKASIGHYSNPKSIVRI